MKKLILILGICILFLPNVISKDYTIDYNNWITYSMADLRYCMINGDCMLHNLVVQNITVENIFNATIIDYTVTGDLNITGNLNVTKNATIQELHIGIGAMCNNGTDMWIVFNYTSAVEEGEWCR